VLFLDEPSRGIDIGVKEQIYEPIDELAQQGRGIILVSSELPGVRVEADPPIPVPNQC
jgi:ABC-type sugar transport system ATPase subunit